MHTCGRAGRLAPAFGGRSVGRTSRESVEGVGADAGGIVELYERGGLVHEGETICRIANPFKTDETTVEAPFTGLLVGVLENPVVYPGNPLCHFIEIGDAQERIIEDQRGTLNR